MTMTRRNSHPIVNEELIDEHISDLLSHVREFTKIGPKKRASSPKRTPDLTEHLRNDLKAYFEDEIVPAIPNSQGGGFIDETELRHELAKKALVGLKLHALKEGAKEINIPLAGAKTSEDFAAAIAKNLEWDSEAVAKFVLTHEEEPTDSSALGTRLYPLANESASVDEIESDVTQFMGRYIRVGLARWYVFVDMSRTDEGVRITGKYMSYKADVDPTKNHASLRSVSKIEEVETHVSPRRKVVEVGNVGIQAAKAAVFAATAVLNQQTLSYIANSGSGARRIDGSIHGSAEFLLNILHQRIPDSGVSSVNPTVARFKFENDDSVDENRPALKAVRFEGNHILDSAQACRFIVEEGRPLANIAFRMHLNSNADGVSQSRRSSFPVKIALESDHVQVVTGLGDDPITAKRAHEIVTTAVWMEMMHGRGDESTLDELIERMTTRARVDQPTSQASILSSNRANDGTVV